MTAYSSACYFARQAADLYRYRGLMVKGFACLPESLEGAVWEFRHEASGLVILLNSSGAVNAKATKARRESDKAAAALAAAADMAAQEAAAAADLAALVASAKEAESMARDIDSELARLAAADLDKASDCLCLLCDQEFPSFGGLVQVCPACFPEGRAAAHAAAFVDTEGDSVPFFDLPELRPGPARRPWPALPAFSFPLAPVARNLESPLMAFAAAFADRAALAAHGRGAF